MKVAVIILNWNGQKLLEKFMPSVVAHSNEAQIYLADNNSSDNSIDFVKNSFPKVKCIALDRNYGYAGGYNKAIEQLQEDLLVLLNSDVAVTAGWLEPAIEAFAKLPNLAAAQPKILDYKAPARFEYAGAAGGFIDMLGIPYCRGRIMNRVEEDNGQYDQDREIFWASGACLFIRRSYYEQVGGLDQDLFAHQEEIDLCWRIKSAGGTVRFLYRSKVLHLGGGTLTAANPTKTYLNFRNTLLVLYKNVGGLRVYPILFLRMLMDGLALLYFLISLQPAHSTAVLKAHFSFYRMLPIYWKKRKKWAVPTQYYNVRSIIWAYFIRNKKRFDQLA